MDLGELSGGLDVFQRLLQNDRELVFDVFGRVFVVGEVNHLLDGFGQFVTITLFRAILRFYNFVDFLHQL